MDKAKYQKILKSLEDLEEKAILKIELNRDFLSKWADKALLRAALGYAPEQIDLIIEKALEELLSKKKGDLKMKNNWKEEGVALRETRLSLKASPEDVMKKSTLNRLEIGDLEKGFWKSDKSRLKAVKAYLDALIQIELEN